jgi:uncharacterized membrane protein YfcA
MMVAFQPWEWALAIVAALIVGISKAGIGGLGMLSVVIFAQLMPAKQATGMVLPLLCFGDIVAPRFTANMRSGITFSGSFPGRLPVCCWATLPWIW